MEETKKKRLDRRGGGNKIRKAVEGARIQLEALALTHPMTQDQDIQPDDGLPPLSPEMEHTIDRAVGQTGSRLHEVVIERFNIPITRKDLQRLSGLGWLNDAIINFYMNLLMERGKQDNYPKVYAFNTFFYTKLVEEGYPPLRRWTREVDLFSHDLLLVPVHLGHHWCLATIDLRISVIKYYDSLLRDNDQCLRALLKYLQSEHQDKMEQPYDTADWDTVNVKNIPRQGNGSDCGVFTCKFAEYASRNAEICFTQKHMLHFRRRMVYEIVEGTLL